MIITLPHVLAALGAVVVWHNWDRIRGRIAPAAPAAPPTAPAHPGTPGFDDSLLSTVRTARQVAQEMQDRDLARQLSELMVSASTVQRTHAVQPAAPHPNLAAKPPEKPADPK